MTIPKIIHHTAPTDPEKWNPVWDKCYESWKENFDSSEFEYIMWNDEDIDKLVEEKYPEYYEDYKSFPMHILQVDFVRNCMLHQYGGIYVDMDVYCYQNFYNELTGEVILLEALAVDEVAQNALMCSVKGADFFKLCMEKSIEKFKNTPNILERLQSNPNTQENIVISSYVKELTGPYLLSEVYENFENKDSIQLLSQKEYNPDIGQYHSGLKIKHMLTGDWGREGKDSFNDPFTTYKEFKKLGYFQGKGIDIDLYNFKS
jgi:mannosyltransferase OCH1-like enzyme